MGVERTPYDLAANPAGLWYDPRHVERWYYGVFEGGGARGMAYPGALAAMAESRAWFRSVAGTSAGAITAAFVGAGGEAARAEDFTVAMFKEVDTGTLAGLRRLLRTGGYLRGDELSKWLDEQFAQQLERITGAVVPRPVDFRAMFAATGIETFVVASDLSLRQPIVFSCWSTPECGVAEAVVASSATPIAFASRLLRVPLATGSGEARDHTIVDGGVWSSFPSFVYADAAFRTQHGVLPPRVDEVDVLGFLLGNEPTETIDVRPGVEFAPPGAEVNAYEWHVQANAGPAPLWCRLTGPVVAAFAAAARVFDRTGRAHRGRWPTPAWSCVAHAWNAVNRLFGALTPPVVAAAVWVLVAGAAAYGAWRWLAELLDGGYPTWTVVASVVVVVVLVLPLLVLFLVALIANCFLLRPARHVLYGLLQTYLTAGGVRSWETQRRNVIALPVPEGITHISFRAAIEQRAAVIAAARQKTKEHLARLGV